MHLLTLLQILTISSYIVVLAIPQPTLQVPFNRNQKGNGKGKETLEDAVHNIKDMIRSITSGSIASVFPSDSVHAGEPFSMMEYHAPCHPLPSLTFLLLPISLTVQNILKHPTKSVSYMLRESTSSMELLDVGGVGGVGRVGKVDGVDLVGGWKDRGMMDHSRVSFIGNMTILPLSSLPNHTISSLKNCYLSYHPDAISWIPNSPDQAHFSMWARMDISDVYYVGGFGDVHYIGHIPVEMLVD